MMRATAFAVLLVLTGAAPAAAQRTEGDFVLRDFTFATGETLAELRIHYVTLGTPRRDAGGVTRNAVLMLHGTTGSGTGLVNPMSPLFGPGARPRHDAALRDSPRWHRPRTVEQAKRRAADEVPEVHLR